MNAQDIIARLDAIRTARQPIGYDLEGATFVHCQAFAESPSRAFCVVTDNLGADSVAVWAALTAVLEDPSVPKWTWNAHHELAVLRWAHGITLRGWEDGMALWFERWPELPKGLKYAASVLTRQPCWTAGINFDDDDEAEAGAAHKTVVRGVEFFRYNATDAARTLELAQHPQLAVVAQSERYRLRKTLVEALTWASLKGINFDRAEQSRLRAELTPQLWAAQAEVDKLAGVVLPDDDSALLAAAARQWCHAVKLRRYVLPAVTHMSNPSGTVVLDAPPVTTEAAVGTSRGSNERTGAQVTPEATENGALADGKSPSNPSFALPGVLAECVPLPSEGVSGVVTPALGTPGCLPGAGPSLGAEQVTVRDPAPGVSLDGQCAGSSLPAAPALASQHVVQGDPANGACVIPPLETLAGVSGGKVKRARKAKTPAPPAPLTWDAALEIAKKDGAAALQSIRHAHAQSRPGQLAELLGVGINVKSTPQVVALLDRLKLPKVFRRGEKGDETARTKDADVLLDLFLRTGHPVTVALLKTIALRTQLQELDRGLDSDGRIRTSFISCGTTTDRTVSKKFLTGSGGNLQTVPKEPVNFRRCYCPDGGAAPGDPAL